MARFLLQAHAPTTGLAHLGTAIAVGHELRGRGHSVAIAYGGGKPELIDAAKLRRREVLEVPADREWTPAEWFRSADELAPVVDSHLEAISAEQPDAIVACHGVAGRVAAELDGVPLLHVFHYLHTTRHARAVSVGQDRRRDLARPRRALRVARARLRRLRQRGRIPLNAAVRELREIRGLEPADPTAIAGCPDSLLALSTAPFLVPARDLPAHWRYVGPISWSPHAPAPKPPSGPGPLAYVSQGSTGDAGLLERSVAELCRDGFRVIATTAELLDPERLASMSDRVVAARMLDGTACMRLADVAVIHGGQQTLLEAVRAGTPVVALPTKSDQIGHLHRLEGLGVGRGLYPRPLVRGAIARTARRVLRRPIQARCAELARRLADDWDGTRNTANLAERLAAGDEPSRRPSR